MSLELTVGEIAALCGGELINGDKATPITAVSTDTRTISGGMLFIPIRGEKFDGHNFIDAAIEKGASAILTELKGNYTVPAIKVEDTRLAMGALASGYLQGLNIPVAAITGSVGKTTTKDMMASVLAQRFKVHKTQGNLNNDIGVPLTVFGLTKEHTAAVIEMGMNHLGEISYLTNIVKPDIAVITNVGVSHIENLGSRQGILKAKCEIFEGLRSNGTALVNGDNDMLITLKGTREKLLLFGTDPSFDIYADNIEEKGLNGIDCDIHYKAASLRVHISTPGRHMVSNALAAAGVGFLLGMTAEEIKRGIEGFVPTGMRMDIIHSGRLTVINDAYNSNPVSAKAAVDVLASCEGKKYAILGDMLELGEFAPSLHYDLGSYAAQKGIDEIIAIGPLSKSIYEGAKSVGICRAEHYPTVEDFIAKAEITSPSTVLVKASRGMKLERITEYLRTI